MAELLGADYDTVLQKLSQQSSNDCLIKRQITRAQTESVLNWCRENGAEGILLLEDVKRVYPEGNFGGSILGFVNVDGDGVSGLKLEYNSRLKGENGRVLTAKNAWGYNMPVGYETAVQARQGSSLTLTVDAHIQHILENYLQAAVEEHHVNGRAVGIVMEPSTGKILAMSTKPDYDPNDPRTITDEQLRAEIDALQGNARKAAQQAQWRNKAVSDLYESRAACLISSQPARRWMPGGAYPKRALCARARSMWRARPSAAPMGISMAAKAFGRGLA